MSRHSYPKGFHAKPNLNLQKFQFIKQPCNPCEILQEDVPNYNCPFTINTGNGNKVSPIWAYLWGMKIPKYKKTKIYKPNYIF